MSWAVALALLFLAAAAAPAGAATALPVREIAAGVFVYEAPVALAGPENEGAIANVAFVIGRDAVAVIDTGGSLAAGRRLLAAVRERTDRPVRYVINTHVHPDHVLGNGAFAETGARIVGHAQLPAALAARAARYLSASRELIGDAFEGTAAVPPTLLVAGTLELDLGDRPLLVEAWPTAHSNTDLTVHDRATDTWFVGDLVFANHVPALDGRLVGWLRTLTALKARPVARIVPGHGPASMPWPAAAAPTERYLARLEADIRELIRAGSPLQDSANRAGDSEAKNWSLFSDFNARNATSAYQELEWSD